MDLLTVEGNEGFFQCSGSEKKLVSQVTPDDISSALDAIIQSPEVGYGRGMDSSAILNPAQRIIFEQLRTSFQEVCESRDSILSEVESTFADAESKYLSEQYPLNAKL